MKLDSSISRSTACGRFREGEEGGREERRDREGEREGEKEEIRRDR